MAAVQAAQAALDQAKTALQLPVTVGEKLQAAAAAAAQVKSWQDVANLETASKALEAALAAGRELAAAHPDPLGNLRKGIDSLPPGHTKESLLVLVDKTRREVALVEGDIDKAVFAVERLQKNVEQWFNDAMDRVSGWYKRWTQVLLVVLALVAVSVTNADTIALSKRLARDSALRASLVAAASDIVKSAPSPSGAAAAPGAATPAPAPTPTPLPPDLRDKVFAQAQQINLPLGWATTPVDPYAAEQVPGDIGGWLLKMCGLLISAAMVSLGAPFWFDTLSRFVNLRGAGTPPGESKKGALADTKR